MEAETNKKLAVTISNNIEVFCTLINLTNYWEKRHTDFPIALEARTRFLPFKKHQAVKMTHKLLKKRWIWHSFFCHLAIYHTDFPEGKPIYHPPPEAEKLFFKKSDTEEIEEYISAVRDFYKKSNYEKFWQEKQPFYKELKANIEEKIENIDIPKIMEDFYGMKKEHYFIVPASQIPDMALNVEVVSDGKHYSYYVQGAFPKAAKKGENYFISVGDLINVAFHEFGHTFLESSLEKHNHLLEKYYYIYKKAKKGMRKKGYRTWHQVFIENLINALGARLMENALGEKYGPFILNIYEKKGYKLVRILYDITGEYERNRDKYQDFETFLPDLFIKLDERMKNK